MENKLDYRSFLGKKYEITIDRPIGTIHPKDPNLIYPINYGYIDGIFAEDNEEVDVYILGENEPLNKCQAKIIAVIFRKNDGENKLVGAIDETEYTIEEIKSLTNFREQKYQTEVVI